MNRVVTGVISFYLIVAPLISAPDTQAVVLGRTFEQQINIINQQFSTASLSDAPTDNTLGIINYNAARYTSPTVYFEAVGVFTDCSGSEDGFVSLYTTGGSQVAGSELNIDCTVDEILRSGALSLASGDYSIRARSSSVLETLTIKSARLIIVQASFNLTATETQIEIGDNDSVGPGGPITALTDPKRWFYDASKYDGAVTVSFEATIWKSNAPCLIIDNGGQRSLGM